MGQAGFIMTYL